MSSPGVGRVGESGHASMEVLAQQQRGGQGGDCNYQRGGHSFPPSPQEDFPVLLPLPSAQGHRQSSLDALPAPYLW